MYVDFDGTSSHEIRGKEPRDLKTVPIEIPVTDRAHLEPSAVIERLQDLK